jgi:glycosyltransferase involved in cell wall biosynthesis
VFLTDWFSEKMGYAENCMPKALAALGHEVHVVTSTAQVYATSDFYKSVYEPYLGPPFVEPQVSTLDGFTLHRLPLDARKRGLHIAGLRRKLFDLRPDVVQTYDVLGPTTVTATWAKPFLPFKLFTGNHVVASVFPLYNEYAKKAWSFRLGYRLRTTLKGMLLNVPVVKCYPATVDAADIAIRFWGVPRGKIRVDILGVDTDLFHPPAAPADDALRRALRGRLGVNDEELLCVYTGRFTAGKNPLRLAQAITVLRKEGHPFRAVFLGSGPQAAEILACEGCAIHPFVAFRDLPPFFRAADIGVWPQQESTSMLDAAACGLPIVVSNRVQAVERVTGNGLQYAEGSTDDLARALRELEAKDVRRRLGACGIMKAKEISWLAIARQRVEDYEAARHLHPARQNAAQS